MKQQPVLKEKSFNFAILIVKTFKLLTEEKREFILSKQLLRSGTSIGANVREANNAESMNDFIHKLAIAQKECDETIYWIDLLKVTEYLPESIYTNIHNEACQLLRIIKSSILTTKQKKIAGDTQ